MRPYKLVYLLYVAARKVIRATGLTKPIRGVVGPVIGRLLLRLAPNANRRYMVNGHEMILAGEGGYPPISLAMGRYEEQTTQVFENLLKPGMLVIDVGAHVGYYTLLAARNVGPAGKVYAFEPEPVNHSLLLKNIELNGYQQVVAKKTAVSDAVGHSTLYLTGLDNGRHSMYRQDTQNQESVAVETTSLDDFLESLGWPQVDLVKIDAEGAEGSVARGMLKLLQKSSDLHLIVEFNPALLRNAGEDPVQFFEIPTSLGFEVFCIEDKKGLVPIGRGDPVTMTNKLLADESSINLLWSKP